MLGFIYKRAASLEVLLIFADSPSEATVKLGKATKHASEYELINSINGETEAIRIGKGENFLALQKIPITLSKDLHK